jgi:hypothetical protein
MEMSKKNSSKPRERTRGQAQGVVYTTGRLSAHSKKIPAKKKKERNEKEDQRRKPHVIFFERNTRRHPLETRPNKGMGIGMKYKGGLDARQAPTRPGYPRPVHHWMLPLGTWTGRWTVPDEVRANWQEP